MENELVANEKGKQVTIDGVDMNSSFIATPSICELFVCVRYAQ